MNGFHESIFGARACQSVYEARSRTKWPPAPLLPKVNRPFWADRRRLGPYRSGFSFASACSNQGGNEPFHLTCDRKAFLQWRWNRHDFDHLSVPELLQWYGLSILEHENVTIIRQFTMLLECC